MKFTLQCAKPIEISPDQIRELVGPEKIESIKQSDMNPLFKAYVLAHEGESRPNKIGEGSVVVKWGRDVIHSLMQKVQSGLKFFFGHNADSSHANRKSFGEVVAKGEMEIGGALHGVVVGYFPEQSRKDAELANTISMEVDADLIPTSKAKEYIAKAVTAITGIALGGASDIPGFSGAVAIGSLQANIPSMIHSLQFNEEPKKTMTIEEALAQASPDQIAGAIKTRRFQPSQLGITPEEVFGKKRKDGTREGGDLSFLSYLDDVTKESSEAMAKLSSDRGELLTRALRHEHKSEIEKQARDAKLPEAAIKLAIANINSYNPTEDGKSIGEYVNHIKGQHELLAQSGYKTGETTVVKPVNGADKGNRTTDENGVDIWDPRSK